MDPEQTFLRVHARLSGMLSQLLTQRIRLVLEFIYLAVAVVLFCLLVVMHINFVQQPGCSSELSGINFTEAQLFHIKITSDELWAQISKEQNLVNSHKQEICLESTKNPDVNGEEFTFLSTKFWSHWFGSSARRSKLIFKSWRSEKELIEAEPKELAITAREAIKAALVRFFSSWNVYDISHWKITNKFSNNGNDIQKSTRWKALFDISKLSELLHIEHMNSFLVQWFEKRSRAFEPTYLYTSEKGYFRLPEVAKARHNIRTINITISAENSCFGNRWQKLLINGLVGYDTIFMNSLLSYPGQGYLYNYQTKEFYDLNYGYESPDPARFGDYFVTKCGVLIMSLFVFFTTTMSVSFTLRETQSRMLRFTVQLQHHARHQLPTFQLIFVHVIESLVFVPIMIGILFFLFEFYDDQLLAFLVLTLVWLCELFTMISVRTSISMQFFPRFFLLYFLVFHIYFFSYAYGFSYLAFSATAAFMQHLILYFWNRFEVPALQRFLRTRVQFQQQPNVQITSSTIYTSTLHIARLNVRNPNLPEQIPTMPTQPDPSQEQIIDNTEPNTRNPPDFVHLDSQQNGPEAEAAPNPNSFSSFLLRILGGASSDGIVSFFSMFRDMRDHRQNYNQPPQQQENEHTT